VPSSKRGRKHARLGKDASSQAWKGGREFQAEAEDAARERRLKEHSMGLGNRGLERAARALVQQLQSNDRPIAVFNSTQAKRLQGIKDGPLLAARKVSELLGEEVVASLASHDELEAYGVRARSVKVRVVAPDGVIEKVEFNCLRLAAS
jgi:hypothetical protein